MNQAPSADRRLAFFVRSVYALFFVSGALGLIYEVLWLRRLLVVFGSTVHAVGTVLAVFFGGLALGSWIFGRLIDRSASAGLIWYAVCEAGIGVYAFLTPPLFKAIEHVYIPIYRASGFSQAALICASFVFSSLVLLVPTILMGGTFPLVSRFLIRTCEERGAKIASLYGTNTFGAVCGTLFVYYAGLQSLGWLAMLKCAGLLNLLIAIVARALNRNLRIVGYHHAKSPVESQAGISQPDEFGRRVGFLFAAFGLSGFSAMVYEVAWTRSLSMVLGSSIYAFCLMLATFLTGLALGSFVARRRLSRSPASLLQFVFLEMCLALYGMVSVGLFGRLPDWFVRLWPLFGGSFFGLSCLQFFVSMLVMALPTFMMGMLFPIVSDLVTGRLAHLGSRLGLCYAINTLGGILGSALSGFWLIPMFGIAQTLILAAMANLAAGLVIYLRFSPGTLVRRLGIALTVAAVYLGLGQQVFVPSWQRQALSAGVFMEPSGYQGGQVAQSASRAELLFYRESLNTTVSVHLDRSSNNLFLKVGGKADASTGIDMGTQLLLAHIPMLVHRDPRQVLVVGLGSGVTLGSAGRYPVSELHCAEIDPAVVEAARYFSAYNNRIHDDPRVKIHVADGRNFLLATQRRYDVIISEPSNPWMAGIASLFTKEFFELCKRRLAEDGVMSQWLHIYRLFPSDVKLILKTFQAVFPHTSVWCSIPGDLVMIGSIKPHQIDYERLRQQLALPAIRQDLDQISLAHPRALLEFFWLGPQQLSQLTSDVAGLHLDDHSKLEFSAPKALYASGMFEMNYAGLERFKAPASAIAPNVEEAAEDAAFHAALGGAYRFRQQPDKAIEAFERAVSLDPGNAGAYLRLGELYAKRGFDLKAQEALVRATELDPSLIEAYRMRARILDSQGRREQALEIYLQAAARKAPDSEFAEEIGNAFRQAKRHVDAFEYLRSAAVQSQAAGASVLLALAETLNDLNQLVEAQRLLIKATDEHPDNAALGVLLGEVTAKQGRNAEAKRFFSRVLASSPRTPQAYFGLGRIAFEEGDMKAARRYMMSGLRYDPYNVKALEAIQAIEKLTHG